MKSNALVPQMVVGYGQNRLVNEMGAFTVGVLLLALLAQIKIVLPFSPVPITGQTFGVSLIALCWGRNRGAGIMAAYLGLGGLGLPFFATSGGLFGATSGYLLGMFFASMVVGELADRGATKSFLTSWAAGFVGSCIVFACGLLVLSFYVPQGTVFTVGLLPFLPGDLVKTVSAAFIASRLRGQLN